jgi:hypothetical protein
MSAVAQKYDAFKTLSIFAEICVNISVVSCTANVKSVANIDSVEEENSTLIYSIFIRSKEECSKY